MIFVSGLGAPETPRLRSDGSWMCVELAPAGEGATRGGVTHIAPDGRTVRRIAETGIPNGLCLDREGTAWVAEAGERPALMRVTLDGSAEVVLEKAEGRAFLLPNDLCFAPSGLLYMTDSGMRMSDWVVDGAPRPDWAAAPFDGRLYEIDLRRRSARIVDDGFRFTNGIAFGPDGVLYVNEMITGDVVRYRVADGHVSGPREAFCNVLSEDWEGGFRGPDGMGFSADGRLWCTVYSEGCVAVVSVEGEVLDRLRTEGRAPTNLAFGPGGERRLYVTEHEQGTIEVFDVDAAGLNLFDGEIG